MVRASSGVSTGVLPFFCVCFGPRTACAGFIGITWPTTIQFEEHPQCGQPLLHRGLGALPELVLDKGRTWIGSTWARSTMQMPEQNAENWRTASR